MSALCSSGGATSGGSCSPPAHRATHQPESGDHHRPARRLGDHRAIIQYDESAAEKADGSVGGIAGRTQHIPYGVVITDRYRPRTERTVVLDFSTVVARRNIDRLKQHAIDENVHHHIV